MIGQKTILGLSSNREIRMIEISKEEYFSLKGQKIEIEKKKVLDKGIERNIFLKEDLEE